MNIRSTPTSIPVDPELLAVMRRAGIQVDDCAFVSVIFKEQHEDAIERIVKRCSLPGSRLSQSAAIRMAVHAFCSGLSQGRRYQSLSDLVRDSVLWAG